jgi:hypothetical protein
MSTRVSRLMSICNSVNRTSCSTHLHRSVRFGNRDPRREAKDQGKDSIQRVSKTSAGCKRLRYKLGASKAEASGRPLVYQHAPRRKTGSQFLGQFHRRRGQIRDGRLPRPFWGFGFLVHPQAPPGIKLLGDNSSKFGWPAAGLVERDAELTKWLTPDCRKDLGLLLWRQNPLPVFHRRFPQAGKRILAQDCYVLRLFETALDRGNGVPVTGLSSWRSVKPPCRMKRTKVGDARESVAFAEQLRFALVVPKHFCIARVSCAARREVAHFSSAPARNGGRGLFCIGLVGHHAMVLAPGISGRPQQHHDASCGSNRTSYGAWGEPRRQ